MCNCNNLNNINFIKYVKKEEEKLKTKNKKKELLSDAKLYTKDVRKYKQDLIWIPKLLLRGENHRKNSDPRHMTIMTALVLSTEDSGQLIYWQHIFGFFSVRRSY